MTPYRTPETNPRTVEDLVFIGCGGKVAALDRATGEVIWKCKVFDGFVTVLYDVAVGLLVGSSGYLWCLDPLTGGQRWHNRLKGFGHGSLSIATKRGATHDDAALADEAAQQQQIAGSTAAIIASSG